MSGDGLSATTFYRRTFALVTAVVVGVLLWRIVEPFLAPLGWALFLAFLLQPLQQRLTQRFGGRESAAAAVLVVLTLVLFVGPLSVLGAVFAAQAGDLATQLQASAVRLEINSWDDLAHLPVLREALSWMEQHLAISAGQWRSWMVAGAERVLQPLAAMGGALFLGALGTVASFLFMLILLFFLVRDGQPMLATFRNLVPMDEAHKERLFAQMAAVTRAVVFSTMVTAIVQGCLVGIAFALTGLPSPVVFGVAGGVLSVVPFGGTALVWGPGALVLAAQGHYGAALFMTAFGAGVIGTVDNLLKPLLISGRAEVPTLAVFIGVLGGLSAFGLVGMFLGPVVIALALALVAFLGEQEAARRAAAAPKPAEPAAPAAPIEGPAGAPPP